MGDLQGGFRRVRVIRHVIWVACDVLLTEPVCVQPVFETFPKDENHPANATMTVRFGGRAYKTFRKPKSLVTEVV